MTDNTELYDFFKGLDRTRFLDNEYKEYAHLNNPLPIGFEQTISQPTLVYEMTARLMLNKELRVLEIGTGSGYQTAFLAKFSKEVYTVERIGELSQKARRRLQGFGYSNIRYRVGDGSKGWNEFAPYDRIIVTAGAGKIPNSLIEQLAPEGRMLVPVGKRYMQELLLIEKDSKGRIIETCLGDVAFVELKGDYGWEN